MKSITKETSDDYLLIFALMRVVLKREAGSIALPDMMIVLCARTEIFLYIKLLSAFADSRPSLLYPTDQQERRAYRCDLFKI